MKKLKLFIVTTALPARLGGGPMRNFNLIKYLSKDQFSVTLFTIMDKKTMNILPEIKNELNIPIYYVTNKKLNFIKSVYVALLKRAVPFMEEYKQSQLKNIILESIKKQRPNIVQISQLKAYYAIKDIIPFLKANNIKVILDAHNVEQIEFRDSINIFNFIKQTIGKWIFPNYITIENNAIKSVDHVFTCSNIDKAFFSDIVDSKKITVIPNGIDISFFRPNIQISKNSLLFMGGANYPPNEEALRYYFFDIHPLVIEKVPDLKIFILCGTPPQWIKNIAKNDPSIIIPGFVNDVRKYLNRTKICIAPIKSGSGTRLKILEYMAMRKPVVSTSKGAEGLDIKHNKNILLADNPIDFTNNIILLLNSQQKADSIGQNARKLIEEKYDWKKIIKNAEYVYRNFN